jgi:Rad3-related DNA helicase
MELRTQAVDRLLEALAPSLAAEFDRVLFEARQQLEAEFQSTLQSALRDAELETLHLAEVRLEEAVLQAREEMRIQLTEGFADQLNGTVENLREEWNKKSDEAMQAAFTNWSAERSKLQDQLTQWQTYAEAQRLLSECTSQPEILSQFLKLSEPFAESLAIYISKSDGLALWRARGNGTFPEQISPDALDPGLYFRPALVRDKMVAAVCAVRPCNEESLNFLMSCFERAIEAFGQKLQSRPPRPPATDKPSND